MYKIWCVDWESIPTCSIYLYYNWFTIDQWLWQGRIAFNSSFFLRTDFEYVVVQQEAPRICFGSSLEKEVLPRSGPNLTPFMRRIVGQDFPNLGPGSYVDDRDAFYDVKHRVRFVTITCYDINNVSLNATVRKDTYYSKILFGVNLHINFWSLCKQRIIYVQTRRWWRVLSRLKRSR